MDGNRVIHNEGRVVGYSAYELYVKQFLSEVDYENGKPVLQPASEKEWLSSNIAMGSSMLLKVPSGSTGKVTFNLPESSKLRAANTLYASFFNGEATIDESSNFATHVSAIYNEWTPTQLLKLKNYGRIVDGLVNHCARNMIDVKDFVLRDSVSCGGTGAVATAVKKTAYATLWKLPVSPNTSYTFSLDNSVYWLDRICGMNDSDICTEHYAFYYSKEDHNRYTLKTKSTTTYLIIQLRNKGGNDPTYEDLLKINLQFVEGAESADESITATNIINDGPRIELYVEGTIEAGNEPLVLLTGFTPVEVLVGEVKFEVADEPENGDFLGPQALPGKSKIILTVPNAFIEYFMSSNYERKIIGDDDYIIVDSTSIIDMESCDPGHYYSDKYQDSGISVDVETLNLIDEAASVLTIYQNGDTPPALYGSKITETGDTLMYPIDTAAPNTLKMFESKEAAIQYVTLVPNTFAMWQDPTNKTIDIICRTHSGQYYTSHITDIVDKPRIDDDGSRVLAHLSQITTGSQTGKFLRLDKATVNDDGSTTFEELGEIVSKTLTPDNSNIDWPTLLEALANDSDIDILGDHLKELKDTLSSISTTQNGKEYVIAVESGKVVIKEITITTTGNSNRYVAKVSANGNTVEAISLRDASGNSLGASVSGDPITSTNDSNISWIDLLKALGNNKGVDILGADMKAVKQGLPSNYIQFPNGLRLYISSSEPSTVGVPIGSIGIGW